MALNDGRLAEVRDRFRKDLEEYHQALSEEVEWCEETLRRLDPNVPAKKSSRTLRRMSKDEKDRILQMHALGKKPAEIAASLDRPLVTIQKFVQRTKEEQKAKPVAATG